MQESVKRIVLSDMALKRKLQGIMDVNPGKYGMIDRGYYHTLYTEPHDTERVQVIFSGGGSFGLMFAFFVGEDLADAACEGDYDCAPNAYALYEIALKLGKQKGVLFIANNFAGDYLNHDMAMELLSQDGVDAKAVYVHDDIFSARGGAIESRGGLIGACVLTKIASAASGAGLSLKDVFTLANLANSRLRSGSVVIDWETETFKLGCGFSGEDPVVTIPYEGWDNLVGILLEHLVEDLAPRDEETLYLTFSRMSRLSYAEGYGMMHTAVVRLKDMGYPVAGCTCGQYFDVFDESGFIVNLFAAEDRLNRYCQYVRASDFVI